MGDAFMEDVPEIPSKRRSEQIYPSTKDERDREVDRMSENIRWLKVWGHLRMKPAIISRSQAFDLASGVAEASGRAVAEVVDLKELDARGSRGPRVYQVNPSD